MKYYIADLITGVVYYEDKKEFMKSLKYNLGVAFDYGDIKTYEKEFIRLSFVDAITKEYNFERNINGFAYGVEK